MAKHADFARRYGSWAIVAGASEGIGAAYAEELAARGLNLILIARRKELLESLASKLSQQHSIKTRTIALDLSAAFAGDQILQNVGDLQIGLLVYNAAFSAIGPFLERPFEDHLREIHTNAFTPLKLIYLLAQGMLA